MRVSTPMLRSRVGGVLLAGYPQVFAAPAFRELFLVLLLAGTASGMAMAYVAVWASETFGIGPQAVAMLYVASGLVGGIGNPLVGLVSDRFGRRRLLIGAQLLVTSVAYLGYTQATSYTAALALVAFSGFGVMGLVLAMVHDLVRSLPDSQRGAAARILAAERTAWSIGIIVGPAVAALIVTLTDATQPVFVVAALIQLAAVFVIWQASEANSGRQDISAATREVGSEPGWTVVRRAALAMLVGALVLLTLPAQTRNMYLPLFVTQVLGEARGTVGPLFTLNAMTAVAMMPHVGALSDRFGSQRILYLSALVGIAYCTLQSLAGSYTQTLAIQVLIGLGIAFWSTSSLLYLQQLLPGRAGMAGGLYVAAQQFTPVVSGLFLGPIAEAAGIPAAFTTTALLVALAAGLLMVAHRVLMSGPVVLRTGKKT